MTAVIQRVLAAKVEIAGETHSSIAGGFLVLLGVSVSDTEKDAVKLADKIAKLRIFEDGDGKMNLSLLDFQEGFNPHRVLVVSNFTLLANYVHGNRPDFLAAARPAQAAPLYEHFCATLRDKYALGVETGVFGAEMKIDLTNDGPITIVMDSEKLN